MFSTLIFKGVWTDIWSIRYKWMHSSTDYYVDLEKPSPLRHALFMLLHNSRIVGIILVHLSKYLIVYLMKIAKSEASYLSKSCLKLLLKSWASHKQRVNTGSSYSLWNYNMRNVPWGYILGPLLFSVVISDTFRLTSLMIIPSMNVFEIYQIS